MEVILDEIHLPSDEDAMKERTQPRASMEQVHAALKVVRNVCLEERSEKRTRFQIVLLFDA